MKEEWRDIQGFEGSYQVSNLGKVRSLDRTIICSRGRSFNKKGKILSMTKFSSTGYRICCLSRGPSRSNKFIHRLVAIAFIENEEGKPEVNHIDGNKLNNIVSNLEWNTAYENSNHSVDTGLYPLGIRHHSSKLSEIEVIEIYRIAHENKISQKNIADKYSISQTVVSNIKTGKIWAKVTTGNRNRRRGE